MPRLHSGAVNDRQKTTELPTIQEVVWQQPQETYLTNIYESSLTETHKDTHMPESKQRNAVQSQTSPLKETSTPSIRIKHGATPRKSNWEYASTEPQRLQETSI